MDHTTDIPKLARSNLVKAVVELCELQARTVTVFQHPKLCVRATFRNKPRRNDTHQEILLTIGRPNYEGRAFVKGCLKAGEPFPIRKPQIHWWPKQKRA